MGLVHSVAVGFD